MSFSNLKRASATSFEKLSKELEKLNSNNSRTDDARFWKPTVDKVGNGSAIIRFLPEPEGEDFPFVRMIDHGFQGPGGWYIENSRVTIGEDDPVQAYNSQLWNSGIESNKDLARKQKMRKSFTSNIYVVNDPGNKDNNGKVFLYKYGKKIFDKINEAAHPEFEDETAFNAFDLWAGANFRLKIRMVEGYRNYDKSEFDDPAPLFDDDKKLEEIYNSEYSLIELIDPKHFKSYDELKTKLDRVVGLTSTISKRVDEEGSHSGWEPKSRESKPETERFASKVVDDDDADLARFQSYADDD